MASKCAECKKLKAENARLQQMDVNFHFVFDVVEAIALQHGIEGTWQQRVEGVRDIAKKGSPAISKLKAENAKLRAALPAAASLQEVATYLANSEERSLEWLRETIKSLRSWATTIEEALKEGR